MYPLQDFEEKLKKIKLGDRLTREDFLEEGRTFVFKAASRYCKRVLVWGRDEELAVALIAFNEAIDRYTSDSGVPFPAYASLVIRSRLTDYHRKEQRNATVNLPLPPGGEGMSGTEFAKAWEVYWEEISAREREEEIGEFEGMLSLYGITFEDLVKSSPKHSDTRNSLTHAARELAEKKDLMGELQSKKKLPMLELEKCTGVSRKTLERGRKYIIAMALLICEKNQFPYLITYLRLSGR